MKRSSSAPCLAEEGNNDAKKVKEDVDDEPNGREYLQLALARVLELQRQVKDDTYVTDNTSDLGESDSEEDVMKEVLIKVFKDLPGSSPAVASIINRATRSQPPQIHEIRDKRFQLSGYDTCRKIALEFMNTVVKNTPLTDRDLERFEMGTFSKIQAKTADHKTGLIENRTGQSSGEKTESYSIGFQNSLQGCKNMEKLDPGKQKSGFENLSKNDKASNFGKLESIYYKEFRNNSMNSNLPRYQGSNSSFKFEDNANNINLGIKQYPKNIENPKNYFHEFKNSVKDTERQHMISRDYEIRVRMLKGLDLHLASKQRDFTAKLMRQ